MAGFPMLPRMIGLGGAAAAAGGTLAGGGGMARSRPPATQPLTQPLAPAPAGDLSPLRRLGQEMRGTAPGQKPKRRRGLGGGLLGGLGAFAVPLTGR